jgi:PRTRC genetic system ThiF family protein
VQLPLGTQLVLVLVGCGGTGSWLAPTLARIARLLGEKLNTPPQVEFWDPDTVEPKNIFRQNFCDREVGQNKAETLAFRFGAAWGVAIEAHSCPFDAGYRNSWQTHLFIGCVDNPKARQKIAEARKRSNGWWLDCGNEKHTGQIVFGGGDLQARNLPGLAVHVPPPEIQCPDLLQVHPEPEQLLPAPQLSCAEQALVDAQGLSINQRMAAEASDYLIRLLLHNDLRKQATYLDLEAGSARSRYIAPETTAEKTK